MTQATFNEESGENEAHRSQNIIKLFTHLCFDIFFILGFKWTFLLR